MTQVCSGQFTQAIGGQVGLAPQADDPLPLAIREGFRGDNYDIEACLGGEAAGLAFRVKDKLNYWYVTGP